MPKINGREIEHVQCHACGVFSMRDPALPPDQPQTFCFRAACQMQRDDYLRSIGARPRPRREERVPCVERAEAEDRAAQNLEALGLVRKVEIVRDAHGRL